MERYFFHLFTYLFSLTFLGEFGRILNMHEGERLEFLLSSNRCEYLSRELRITLNSITFSSSARSKIIRYENITKGPQDIRHYRGLKLENDLQILLISSPNLRSASAAMTVGVGSLNDFDELPGTAYFVGEMLNHMGTSTSPGQDFVEVIHSRLHPDLQRYAMFPETGEDEQKFYFEINVDFLYPALEIFAEFFNQPAIMTSDSRTQIEVYVEYLNWLHSSGVLHENDSKWKLQQVQKSMSTEGHPFNHSSYGNLQLFVKYLFEESAFSEGEHPLYESLVPHQTKLHDKLREFYSRWYSSNIMRLVVLGKESLDDLERVTVPLFENIPNKRVERLTFSYEQHPWKQENLRCKVYSAFSASYAISNRTVRLVFRVPDVRPQYKTAPELYVMEFLKRKDPKSLIPVLKNRNLCTFLNSKYEVKAGIGFFTIKCEVPPNNELLEDEIVELIFQYISLLRKSGIHEWIFKENGKRRSAMFSSILATEHIESIVSAMQVYPMDDLLTYKYFQNDWKPLLIEKFLSHLTPDNMNVFIDSEKFHDVLAEQKMCTWYDIPYKVERIPDQLIEKWKTMDVFPDFQIPQQNEFLAGNWDIHPLKENEPENPFVIHESHRSRFWFSQDNRSSSVRIKFGLFYLRGDPDPTNPLLFCIFSQMLKYLITDYVPALQESGYEWRFEPYENFIEIYLHGYSDKIQIVLEKIVSKIAVEQLTGSHVLEHFDKFKAECIRRQEVFQNLPQVNYRLRSVLTETATSWSPDEIIITSQSLRFGRWEKFVSRMFSHVYIQGIVLGNCTKQSAIDTAKIIEMPFHSTAAALPQEMFTLVPRVVELEGGKHFIDIMFGNISGQKSHFHYIYYQYGTATHQDNVISTLLMRMITKKCHIIENHIMVQCSKIHSVIGLLVWTLPTEVHPYDVDSLFENCLRKVHVLLQEMTVVMFEEYVKFIIDTGSNFPDLTNQYWDNITRGFYPDDLVEDEKPVSKADVLSFFEDLLHEHSPNRRKYTVLIFPKDADLTSLGSIPGTTKIEDVITFKNGSNLLPLPLPFLRAAFNERRIQY